MRIEHRTPSVSWFAAPVSDAVESRYEARVQQFTQRGEREHQQAEARLARAEQRLAKAIAARDARKRILQLRELVTLRQVELAEIERLMLTPPVVRGDKQVRHRTGADDHLELGSYERSKKSKRRGSSQ